MIKLADNTQMNKNNLVGVLELLIRNHPDPEVRGKDNKGNQNEIQRQSGMHQPTLQRILSGKTKDPRDSTIKPLADFFGVSIPQLRGYEPLDDSMLVQGGGAATHSDAISIPIMDAPGSMGEGELAPENDTIVGGMRLSMWFVRHVLPSISRPDALRVVTGRGDSMAPTFRDGDPLIVDTGITSIQDDAVYMFYRDDKLFIKRLQQLSGGSLMVISDNEKFKDETVSADDAEHIRVIARVLYAWRGERL